MANSDSQLRASEIKDVLLAEIERLRRRSCMPRKIGEVLEVRDGIARIYGLTNAMASEMLDITSQGEREKLGHRGWRSTWRKTTSAP